MDYNIKSHSFIAEYGKGTANVVCKDALGHETETNHKVRMGGLGVKFGVCKAEGHIEAVGLGFTLDEFLSVMGRTEVGVILGELNGGTLDLGASVNSNLNFNLTAGGTKYSGACIGLGSIQGLFFEQDQGDDEEPESDPEQEI